MPTLTTRLSNGDVVLIDGATGSEIERRGVAMIDKVWSGVAVLDHPDVVQAVHEDYIRRGAELVIANTYACSRHVLEQAGFGDEFERVNRIGVELALAARDAVGNDDVVVAASISTTEMERPGEQPAVEVARKNYLDQARIHAEAGADMFALEMMREITHTQLALDAVYVTGLPVWAGYACRMRDGEPWLVNMNDRLAEGLEAIAGQPIELVAIMHTEVDDIDPCLDVVLERWDGPVGVYPHLGLFENFSWIYNDSLPPEKFTEMCLGWIDRGVQVVGGCCGIGPEHISHLRDRMP